MLGSIARRLAWLSLLLAFNLYAQSGPDAAIPPALKDWRGWAPSSIPFAKFSLPQGS